MREERRTFWAATLQRASFLLLMLFSFLLPLVFYPLNTSYPYTKTAFALVALSLVFLLEGLKILLTTRYRRWRPALLWPLGALWLLAWARTVAEPASRAWVALVLFLYFLLLYLVVADSLARPRQATRLLGSLILAGGLVAAYALLQYLHLTSGGGPGPAAMIATLGNKNYVASFLAPLVPPGLALALGRRYGPWRALWLGLCALLLATVVLAGSRAAFLGLGLSLGFFFLGRRPHRARWWAGLSLGLGSGVVAVGLSSWWALPGLSPAGLSASAGGRSLLERAFDWQVAWRMFLDHPWSGVGLEGYPLLFLDYKAKLLQALGPGSLPFYLPRAVQAHSEPLQLAAELGVGGLALLAGGLWRLWTHLRGQLRAAQAHPAASRLRLGLGAGLLCWGIISLFDFPLHRPESAWTLAVLAGCLHARGLSRRSAARQGTPGWPAPAKALLVLALGLILTVIALTYRDFRANLHLEAGQVALEWGRLQSAQAHLTRSLSLSVLPHEALFYLGALYYELEDYPRAISALEQSRQGRVTEATDLLLAQAQLQAGHEQKAWDALERLLASEPHPAHKLPAYFLRAQLYQRRGELGLALAQLDHVVAERPDWVEAYLLQAEIYAEREELSRAEERLKRGLAVASKLLGQKRALLRQGFAASDLPLRGWLALPGEVQALQGQISRLQGELEALGH